MFRYLVVSALIVAGSGSAFAQSDLSGSWAARNHEDGLERGGGPYAVDYAGLPLNDEGRAKALAYSESQYSMIERQCNPWPPPYLAIGPFGMKVWNDTDPVTGATVAWHIGAWEDRAENVIWMDGRPHPSDNAPHPRGGFSTGTWEGETLVVRTTHMKAGAIRRNGAPSSDRATMTTRFLRHGGHLTVLVVWEDYGIPRESVLGGAAGMYPEFRKTIRDRFVRPEK